MRAKSKPGRNSGLQARIGRAAARLRTVIPPEQVSEEDLHLILWNLLRTPSDPGDFLLKRSGAGWAR